MSHPAALSSSLPPHWNWLLLASQAPPAAVQQVSPLLLCLAPLCCSKRPGCLYCCCCSPWNHFHYMIAFRKKSKDSSPAAPSCCAGVIPRQLVWQVAWCTVAWNCKMLYINPENKSLLFFPIHTHIQVNHLYCGQACQIGVQLARWQSLAAKLDTFHIEFCFLTILWIDFII